MKSKALLHGVQSNIDAIAKEAERGAIVAVDRFHGPYYERRETKDTKSWPPSVQAAYRQLLYADDKFHKAHKAHCEQLTTKNELEREHIKRFCDISRLRVARCFDGGTLDVEYEGILERLRKSLGLTKAEPKRSAR